MTYKAVIFDLDGTLLDTIDDIADSVNTILTKYGFDTFTTHEYKLMVGEGIEFLVKRAVDKNLERIPEKYIDEVRTEYHKRWNNKTKPYDGIPDLLNGLSEKNIKLAVLSNKPEEFTIKSIHHFFPNINFEFIMGANLKLPLKPDPTSALKLTNDLALNPSEIIFVGDTKVDMETAVNAEMKPVGVSWGFRSKDELLESGAEIVIDDPRELLKLL